jgi:hypothetical protein
MIESKFKGRNIVERPGCPFCSSLLERPEEARASDMPAGSCSCGAVYICDVTGHNLGAALVDALLKACKGESDAAWNLMPEEDYLERQLKHYDIETHQIIHGGVYQGRRIAGTLLFIRLKGCSESPQAERSTAQDQTGDPLPVAAEAPREPLSKQEVEAFVASYELRPLLASAKTDKRILRNLKRLLYSPDELLRRRAAEAMGRVSAAIYDSAPGTVSRLLQELFSSVTDTASSTWGAVDAIGEIIRFRPDAFSSFIPQLAQLSRDRSLLEDVLRAFVEIGRARPEALKMNPNHLVALLDDQDARIQGYAATLVGQLRLGEAKAKLEKLCASREEMSVYEDGFSLMKTLGRLAAEALSKL